MWADDGQNAVQEGAAPNEMIVQGKPSAGTPVNARFTTAVTPEAGYFEIDVLNCGDGAFVGVTSTAGFKKGWGCKGLLFGGNLSSGNALVRGNFGERLATGMTVGVLTEFVGGGATERVRVTFWQDGKCLGPAFLSQMTDPDSEIFPLVHANKEGDKFAIRFGEAPAHRTRGATAAAEGGGAPAGHPAVGHWVLTDLMVGPELGAFPLEERTRGKQITFEVDPSDSGQPDAFDISAQIVNPCSVQVTSAPDAALEPFDRLTPGAVRAGRMMGPPEMMEVEEQICRGLGELQKWVVAEGKLMLSGPTAEMAFKPADPGAGGDDGDLPAMDVALP